MPMALAELILRAAGAYLAGGLLFAIAFLPIGVARVDGAARGAPIGFRLVILPAVMLLWPLLAWRWMRAHRGPPLERSPHIVASERHR